MDPRTKSSPLLSPRPDFLGVGWGRQRANIFFELLSISFISPFVSSPKSSDSHHQDIVSNDQDNRRQCIQIDKPNNVNTATVKASKPKPPSQKTEESLVNHEHNIDLFGKEEQLHGATNDHLDYSEETKQIFNIFQKLKIPFETEVYRPKADRVHVDKNIFYCKNLFLKDRKGQFYLIIFHEDTDMDLKLLRKTLGAYRNFNFATAEDMMRILHCGPGGVTPLALMYESAREVTMVVSESLLQDEAQLMFHPLDASLATKISLPCLLRFLKHFGHVVRFIE